MTDVVPLETTDAESMNCECERWRDGATICPVHGTVRPDLDDEDQAVTQGVVDSIAAAAAANAGGPPVPMLAGTFVMYPRHDGGIVMVMDVQQSSMGLALGQHRMAAPVGVVRALSALMGGGGRPRPLKAARALLAGRRARG